MSEMNDSHMDQFDVFAYERYFANGICIVKEGKNTIYMSETDDGYIKRVIPDDPEMVGKQTTYFSDTLTLSGEGSFLKGWDIEIGVWKEYAPDGEVVKEINKDENYPLSWDEMRGCFLQNDIRLNDVRMVRRTQDAVSGRYLWVVIMKSPKNTLDIACFDAQTGDLIERKKTKTKVS